MKKIIFLLLIGLTISGCNQKRKNNTEHKHKSDNEVIESKKKPLSPHTSTIAMVGDADIHIDYSSPGVRGRIIFGGLLPYDEVWQSGAHMATWIETDKDLAINEEVLPAGKYGFFTIPSKDEWTIIFNSNWNQHGKDDYDQKDDILRFKINPVYLENKVEHLEYTVKSENDSIGHFSLAWDNVKVSFSFRVI